MTMYDVCLNPEKTKIKCSTNANTRKMPEKIFIFALPLPKEIANIPNSVTKRKTPLPKVRNMFPVPA
ncbi:MAG: hypothetical protein ACTTKC_11440 [Treponema sp.]|uniref:hypothetical protein n=1 Tax=Treponema sp. TaxID=166 RepID=UPI003FA2953F